MGLNLRVDKSVDTCGLSWSAIEEKSLLEHVVAE